MDNTITEAEMEQEQALCDLFHTVEPTVSKPSYYHNGPCPTDALQEYVIINVFQREIGRKATQQELKALKKAFWTGFAIKHLSRCGLKDDNDVELKKAENYAHRARTEEWQES